MQDLQQLKFIASDLHAKLTQRMEQDQRLMCAATKAAECELEIDKAIKSHTNG